jgi:hypothetical protein
MLQEVEIMTLKIHWLAVLCASVAMYGLAGCELQEACDPEVTDCETPEGDTGGEADAGEPDAGPQPEYQTYHYVLIDDLEDPGTSSRTHTSGVDIFGVQLVAGGSTTNASQIHDCNFGTGDNGNARDCNQALGAPVGDCDSTTSNNPDFDADYVALGGLGGYLIVSFGSLEEIEEGDEIIVHECGQAQNSGATEEFYDYSVGVATDASDPNWLRICSRASGVSTCRVPSLPQVELN